MINNILTVNSKNLVLFIQKKRPQLGQVQILAIILFLLLIPTTFIVAQNATGNFSAEGNLVLDETQMETQKVTETIIQENTTTEPPEEDQTGTQLNESGPPPTNEARPIDIPENVTPEINVTVNVTEQNETQQNETLVTPPENESSVNVTTNVTGQIQNETQYNETEETIPNVTGNITANESIDLNVTINQTTNQTINQTEAGEIEILPGKSELRIEIISPERITRGETFSLEARVYNTGQDTARDVILYWVLPDDFVILSGSGSVDCQEVAPQTSCWNNVTATVSLSSNLGLNDISVRVSYSE